MYDFLWLPLLLIFNFKRLLYVWKYVTNLPLQRMARDHRYVLRCWIMEFTRILGACFPYMLVMLIG